MNCFIEFGHTIWKSNVSPNKQDQVQAAGLATSPSYPHIIIKSSPSADGHGPYIVSFLRFAYEKHSNNYDKTTFLQ